MSNEVLRTLAVEAYRLKLIDSIAETDEFSDLIINALNNAAERLSRYEQPSVLMCEQRTWKTGDPEPSEGTVYAVRDKDGDLWSYRAENCAGERWDGSSWEFILNYAPLTEVVR